MNSEPDVRRDISARSFLSRALKHLESDELSSTWAAALELRLGIEARYNEYLSAYEKAVGQRKREWQLNKLEKQVETAFRTGGKLVQLVLVDGATNAQLGEFWHTPVTKSLRAMGERLGNNLHYTGIERLVTNQIWRDYKAYLLDVADELKFATTGTLTGPPINKPSTNSTTFSIEGDWTALLPPGRRIGHRITLWELVDENKAKVSDGKPTR